MMVLLEHVSRVYIYIWKSTSRMRIGRGQVGEIECVRVRRYHDTFHVDVYM